MTPELKKFLNTNRAAFKLATLEKAAKLPLGTLTLVLKGYPSRHLSAEQEERVYKYLTTLAVAIVKHLTEVEIDSGRSFTKK